MGHRVVLITGAGQRLGAATARRLMKQGCHVLLHVRSSIVQAEAVVASSEKEGGSGEVLVADLTVDSDVERLVQDVTSHPLVVEHGLFGLVHNASF